MQKRKVHAQEKSRLHPRNKNRERYDFNRLTKACPHLIPFVNKNIYGDDSIDFAHPGAVKMLNKAILKLHYGLEHWDIPEGYLCPPIPGRADYIHQMADLLARKNFGTIPQGPHIKCLDIGVGANCIYPIIGNSEYGWSFVGADIDSVALAAANNIIALNPALTNNVECRWQKNPTDMFFSIIQKDEYFDVTFCNPPFHASAEEAQKTTLRKLNNLNDNKVVSPVLNFAGQPHELWCDGGESKFIHQMIRQSSKYPHSCFWFSTLVSKQSNLKSALIALKHYEAAEVETIPMGQGNKTSRIIAWTFLSPSHQKEWKNERWKESKALIETN